MFFPFIARILVFDVEIIKLNFASYSEADSLSLLIT